MIICFLENLKKFTFLFKKHNLINCYQQKDAILQKNHSFEGVVFGCRIRNWRINAQLFFAYGFQPSKVFELNIHLLIGLMHQ